MKLRIILLISVVAILAGAGGWLAAKRSLSLAPLSNKPERKVLFYQSPMHPWIKSDKPGKCTICGMDLVPVYEGDKGFEAGAGGVFLRLNSINIINVQTASVRRHPLRQTPNEGGAI